MRPSRGPLVVGEREADGLVPVYGGHHQCVGTEVGTDHLTVFHRLADHVTTVEVREGECPDHLREEGEEGCEDVGDAQMKDEEVHAGHFCSARQTRGSLA